MTTNVYCYFDLAHAAQPGAVLALTPDQQNRPQLTARSGRFAKWSAIFRKSENRLLARQFVDALTAQYGRELADQATAAAGVDRAMARGKPLRCREVRAVSRQVYELRESFAKRNAALAEQIRTGRLKHTDGSHGVSPAQVAIAAGSQSRYRENHTVEGLIDPERISDLVRQQVMVEGRDGKHLVTVEESARILTGIVSRELDAAYLPARTQALADMTLKPGTIAFEVLSEAFAEHQPPIRVGPGDLTESARTAFVERLHEALRRGDVPANQLRDTDALRSLARAHAARFLAERDQACAAVQRLESLTPAQSAALSSLVMRDNIPAGLVPGLGWAYRAVHADLARLAEPSTGVEQQKNCLASISYGFQRAFSQSGSKVCMENQDQMHEWAWRFLLAPGGSEQIEGLQRGFVGKECLLRGIAEGATWYRLDCPGTREWNRRYMHVDPALNGTRVHSEAFRDRAARYSTLLLSLNTVLEDESGRPVTAQPLELDDCPNDAAISALRSLGIPFPAPNRVGQANRQVPLSVSQTREMNRQLHFHLEDSAREGVDASGLAIGCKRDLQRDHQRYLLQQQQLGSGRAVTRYYIDSDDCLPQDPDTVAAALRRFCMEQDADGHARVNHEMLRKISAMAHRATFDCVHLGCMDLRRPDLAMVNGRIESAVQSVSYKLFRTDDGEVRLHLEQVLRPCWYSPVNGDSPAHAAALTNEPDGGNRRVSLNPNESLWRTGIEMSFDPQTHDPSIYKVDIDYKFVAGRHDQGAYPYFIPDPNQRPAGD